MIKMFLAMIGLSLHEKSMNQFMKDRNPYQFEFIVQGINYIIDASKKLFRYYMSLIFKIIFNITV